MFCGFTFRAQRLPSACCLVLRTKNQVGSGSIAQVSPRHPAPANVNSRNKEEKNANMSLGTVSYHYGISLCITWLVISFQSFYTSVHHVRSTAEECVVKWMSDHAKPRDCTRTDFLP